ncbi:hypothetical protein [Actimicrobium sp. GrIS 1.19]|uniref:hypothetical protein n=1 Tax=Actimicrobium sp. GrIS 1.19 TaxID=3071708 RepID=UPI002E11EDBB
MKVLKQWVKLCKETPLSTVRNDIPGAEANATGIGCVTAYPIVVQHGPPDNRDVRRLHANAIEMETGRTYAAGQSPMDFPKSKNFLQQGIETRQGVVQFVSRTAHRTWASKEYPILDQLKDKFGRNPWGVDMELGERYEIRDVVAVDGAAAAADRSDHRHVELTVHDRETKETFTVPVTQIALAFNGGKMLKEDAILRANHIVDAHRALARDSDGSSQQTDPLMVSQGGIGRNAALIVYREICRQLADGAIQTEADLDGALEAAVLRGREQRGPNFIHTIEQFDALRTTLLGELRSPRAMPALGTPASPSDSAGRARIEQQLKGAGDDEAKRSQVDEPRMPPAPRRAPSPTYPAQPMSSLLEETGGARSPERILKDAGVGEEKNTPPDASITSPTPGPTTTPAANAAPPAEPKSKSARGETIVGSMSPKTGTPSPAKRRFSFFGREKTPDSPVTDKTGRNRPHQKVSGDEGAQAAEKRSASKLVGMFKKRGGRSPSPPASPGEPASPRTQRVIDKLSKPHAATRSDARIPFDRLAFELKDYGGGGDCLWHSLRQQKLPEAEVDKIRKQVADVRRGSLTGEDVKHNYHQVDNALVHGQGGRGFNLTELEREKGEVTNERYADFQALRGSFGGDDEIEQWLKVSDNRCNCVVVVDGDVGHENTKIFSRAADGSVRVETTRATDNRAENAVHLNHVITQARTNRSAVALYRSSTHFQRILNIRKDDEIDQAMQANAARLNLARERAMARQFDKLEKNVKSGVR